MANDDHNEGLPCQPKPFGSGCAVLYWQISMVPFLHLRYISECRGREEKRERGGREGWVEGEGEREVDGRRMLTEGRRGCSLSPSLSLSLFPSLPPLLLPLSFPLSGSPSLFALIILVQAWHGMTRGCTEPTARQPVEAPILA